MAYEEKEYCAKYSDLGKTAQDLFTKHFNFGDIKLECSTQSDTGLRFKTTGTRNLATGAVSGNLETTSEWKDYGLTLVENWNTNNVLKTEATLRDKPVEGLGVGVDASFEPYTGNRSAVLKAAYRMTNLHATTKADLNAGPEITADAVACYKFLSMGCTTAYNVKTGSLSKTAACLNYRGQDYVAHSTIDSSKISASLYHDVNPSTAVGVQLGWSKTKGDTTLAFAWEKYMSRESLSKVKLDNKGMLGLTYVAVLNNSYTATISCLVDTMHLKSDNHKVGLTLSFDF